MYYWMNVDWDFFRQSAMAYIYAAGLCVQGQGLSQKLASRKGLAAERMPTKEQCQSV